MKTLISIILCIILEASIPLVFFFLYKPENKINKEEHEEKLHLVIPSKRYRYWNVVNTPIIFKTEGERYLEKHKENLDNFTIQDKTIEELIVLTDAILPAE